MFSLSSFIILILQRLTWTLSTQALLTTLSYFASSSPAVVPVEFAFQLELRSLLLSSEGQEPDTILLFHFIYSQCLPQWSSSHSSSSFLNSRPISILSVPICVTFSPITEPLSSVWAALTSSLCLIISYLSFTFHLERPWMTSPNRSDILIFIVLCTQHLAQLQF